MTLNSLFWQKVSFDECVTVIILELEGRVAAC
jgi:hypothetical protein